MLIYFFLEENGTDSCPPVLPTNPVATSAWEIAWAKTTNGNFCTPQGILSSLNCSSTLH